MILIRLIVLVFNVIVITYLIYEMIRIAREPMESWRKWLIIAGGITYSVGIIFHLWDRLKFQNVLWHVFVVAGSICHLWAVFHVMVLDRL